MTSSKDIDPADQKTDQCRRPPYDSDRLLTGIGSHFMGTLADGTSSATSSFTSTDRVAKYSQTMQVAGGSMPDLTKISSSEVNKVQKPERSNSSPAALSAQSIDATSSLNIRLWFQGTDDYYYAGHSRQNKRSNT